MKKLMLVSLSLLFLAFFLPLIVAAPLSESPSAAAAAAQSIKTVTVYTPPSPDSMTIKLYHEGSINTLSMQDYLIGVVAAEMPASFNIEALKAQAVASRTYAVYNIKEKKHQDFALCDSSSCCSAYSDVSALREKWGLNFDVYYAKIKSAVEATDGKYLTWEGQPILAAFHSSSYGSTEASENVWSAPRPYLKAVSSPETADKVTNLFTTVTVSQNDFRETILKKYPDAIFGSDAVQWISSVLYDESGRVSYLFAGGVKITGTELRQLFNLRSAAFTYRAEREAFVFSVSGYGHGVGMSQYGANILASRGLKYDEILKTYYSGVQISELS
jgi:stage II sporulation protein D